MTKPVQPKRRKDPRTLRSDEAEIWNLVKDTVRPLRPKRLPIATEQAEEAMTKAVKTVAGTSSAKPPRHVAATMPTLPRPKPPAVAGLNRRDTQKLGRGNVEIDARIDLHGMSVERGRIALLNFIEGARAQDFRNVLVITGKGASQFTRHTLHSKDIYHAPERQGRLRAAFPGWMNERIFADHVVGFQPAHPRHGGGGAFYVRLRRKAGRP